MQRLLAAFTSLAMLSSGCSIAFLEKPRVTPDNKVECESSYVKPMIDTAVAVVATPTPLVYDKYRDRTGPAPSILIPIAIWGVALGAAISAVVGYKRVGRCRHLKESVTATTTPPPAVMAPAPTPDAAPAPAQ